MAPAQPSVETVVAPAKITCIQPGGGFCLGLEMACCRWRRWWLRRFRPEYVRRMREMRQGHCEACPHDIIDARDLKLYRNVCGYSFAAQDPFRQRSLLPLARAGRAEVLWFSGLC